jgi:hypothetical protein
MAYLNFHGNEAIFQLPTKHRTKLTLPDSNLCLIHIAAYFDSLETFLWLFHRGTDIRSRTADSYWPLHYACAGSAAECAAYILSRDPTAGPLKAPPKFTTLHLAIWANADFILQLLLDAATDFQHSTSLLSECVHISVVWRFRKCLEILLRKGGTSILIVFF